MANLNKILLIGNLTRDPQLSYLPSQTPVVEFGLATNRKWTAQDGAQREETCFVDCRCYGRQAETLNKYVRKGQPLFVEGRLQLDTWEDQATGQRRSRLKVVADNVQFLGGAGGRPSESPAGGARGPGDDGGSPGRGRGGPAPRGEPEPGRQDARPPSGDFGKSDDVGRSQDDAPAPGPDGGGEDDVPF